MSRFYDLKKRISIWNNNLYTALHQNVLSVFNGDNDKYLLREWQGKLVVQERQCKLSKRQDKVNILAEADNGTVNLHIRRAFRARRTRHISCWDDKVNFLCKIMIGENFRARMTRQDKRSQWEWQGKFYEWHDRYAYTYKQCMTR